MLRKFWKSVVYVFSMQAEQDRMDAFIKRRAPKTEEERVNAVREYFRMRGGF